jgi:hypothetical protein
LTALAVETRRHPDATEVKIVIPPHSNVGQLCRYRLALSCAILAVTLPVAAHAQFATIGGGVLVSNRPPEPVAELHAETPPVRAARAYLTLSWTDESAKPTLITAAERALLQRKAAIVGLGAGLLWLEGNDYRPCPIIVSSTVVPVPIPRTALVAIGSTQPFQEFAWSLVLKVGVTLWFVR